MATQGRQSHREVVFSTEVIHLTRSSELARASKQQNEWTTSFIKNLGPISHLYNIQLFCICRHADWGLWLCLRCKHYFLHWRHTPPLHHRPRDRNALLLGDTTTHSNVDIQQVYKQWKPHIEKPGSRWGMVIGFNFSSDILRQTFNWLRMPACLSGHCVCVVAYFPWL